MFPTTVWTCIERAGDADAAALDEFARRYRAPVLQWVRRRLADREAAEDVCQEVFVRVLGGGVLAKADPARGRFRGLLLTVARRVVVDRLRRRRELPAEDLDPPAAEDDGFDEAWALHLAGRALAELEAGGSPYFAVLQEHLDGGHPPRNKLWIARKKLAALVRREVALTCATRADYEDELAHLARWLVPRKKP